MPGDIKPMLSPDPKGTIRLVIMSPVIHYVHQLVANFAHVLFAIATEFIYLSVPPAVETMTMRAEWLQITRAEFVDNVPWIHHDKQAM